jgi:hypothetical protein
VIILNSVRVNLSPCYNERKCYDMKKLLLSLAVGCFVAGDANAFCYDPMLERYNRCSENVEFLNYTLGGKHGKGSGNCTNKLTILGCQAQGCRKFYYVRDKDGHFNINQLLTPEAATSCKKYLDKEDVRKAKEKKAIEEARKTESARRAGSG